MNVLQRQKDYGLFLTLADAKLVPILVVVSLLGACKSKGNLTPGGNQVSSAASQTVSTEFDDEIQESKSGRKIDKAPGAGETIKIPQGHVKVGSFPGDPGRDPLTEPVIVDVELGPFEMDKLPYPNDPNQPPKVSVSRDQAEKLCQERGQRLCTEVEWERACKGDQQETFAAGKSWDASCADKPNSCASSLGVLAMGGSVREWTASNWNVTGKSTMMAVVRGASKADPTDEHRCAHRRLSKPSETSEAQGFRCCKGPPNAAVVPPQKAHGETFAAYELKLDELKKILTGSSRLAPYVKGLAYFSEEEATNTVLSRGDAGAKPGPAFTTTPVLWRPIGEEEVVVVAVKAKKDVIIAALYHLPDKSYRIASALVLKDERGPVVLSYTQFQPNRVSWTTCWKCRGEEGYVTLRDRKRVVVVHR
jgi:hypothetical protein